MPTIEGLEARKAALRMLDAVLRKGQTLDSAAQFGRDLPPADRALSLAIAGEALRRLPDLDALIDSATRQRLPGDAKARAVLRLALAQKLGLGTPDHAIVSTALPLVDGGPRRLVHGVLGTLLRRGLERPRSAALPDAVAQRWRSAWGDEAVAAASRQIVSRPALDLTFAEDSEARAYADEHGGVSLAPRNVRLQSGAVAQMPGFGQGRWWVQDLAASLPSRLVPPASDKVLDLCAAPGGKTMQLAAANHAVTAVDASASRLGRLRENLDRTQLGAELIAADALTWEPDITFGAILLDAPCSATGTFRRHPEVLYRARHDIVTASVELQRRLLDRAAKWLRPDGALVYAVCSLEPQEGEEVVSAFLADQSDFALAPPASGELPDFAVPSAEGWVRILPGLLEEQGGLDGFFMARLVRRGA